MKYLIIFLFFILSFFPKLKAETYTVKAGDTLYSISHKFGLELKNLMKKNNILSPKDLKVGAKLDIASLSSAPSSSSTYVVEIGDTYYSIARKYRIPLKNLLSYNHLEADSILKVGQVLSLTYEVTSSHELTQQSVAMQSESITKPKKTVVAKSTPSKSPLPKTIAWPVEGTIENLDGKLEGVKIYGTGDPRLKAVKNGNVVWVGPYRGFGNVILVSSGDYIYIYGGNNDIYVNVGQKIKKGDLLGSLNPANQTAYFAIYKDGIPIRDVRSIL